MRRHLLVPFVALALFAGACSGGDDGSDGPSPSRTASVSDLPADQILAKARDELAAASSVRLKGTVAQGTDTVTVDVTVKGSEGGTGTLQIGTDTFEVVRIGTDVYIKTGAAFYAKQPNPKAAAILADKWIKAPAVNADFTELAALTDLQKVATSLLAAEGTLTKGAVVPVGSEQAIEVRSDAAAKRVVLVSTTTGRPLRVTSGDGSVSTVDLLDYDLPVTLAVPAPLVDPATVPQ